MDERRDFTSFSTVFQSYQDARDENEKLCAVEPVGDWKIVRLKQGSYPEPPD